MDCNMIEILIGIIVLFLGAYYYLSSTYDFWHSRGVPGPKPMLVFGNFKDIILNKISIGDYLLNEYKNYKNTGMFGIFSHRRPILILKDPEFIKSVLIKDFSNFSDRGQKIFEKIDPLSQHLFNLEHARWKLLRSKLSPVFSSGKLKEMFYLLLECADHFEKFLDNYTTKNVVIEVRELTAKFTTDVIGVCAFGLNMNALADDESQFRKIGRKIFQATIFRVLRFRIRETAPWLFRLLGPIMYDYEINNFFIDLMKNTMDYRKKNNIKRKDFVDLLMEIRDNPDKVGNIGKYSKYLKSIL
jgi:cytochrome P450 family 6